MGASTSILANSEAVGRQAYSVAQFCERFAVGRSKTYEEIRAGRLRVRKLGARTLIAHEDAMAWFAGLPKR